MAESVLKTPDEMTALCEAGEEAWNNALLAARVFAVAGNRLGGIHLRSRAGPVRNAWMDHVRELVGRERNWIKITPQVPTVRLTGGLDISATALSGKPISETGLLNRANSGTLVIGLAEKLEASPAAIISAAMDTGTCRNPVSPQNDASARFSVIAIDEGLDESETLPSALIDRLGLRVGLDQVGWNSAGIEDAADPLPDWNTCENINLSDEILNFLAAFTSGVGTRSIRPLFHLSTTARVLCALEGKTDVTPEHAAGAIRLCLGFLPAFSEPAEETEQPSGETGKNSQSSDPEQHQDDASNHDEERKIEIDLEKLLDLVVDTKKAAGIGDLNLKTTAATKDSRAASGKSGNSKTGARRGRPTGLVNSPPFPEARPDIPATIRTAAPWQKLRQKSAVHLQSANRLSILTSDFRYKRYKHATRSAAIFAVDASGSTALERLGETKGAIELLLANCYIRRDEVALVTFRGTTAETALEPTRSLVRAKRTLSELAGGGPTPLALGIRLAFQTALNVRRQGFTPIIILLTDGSGNIDLSGEANRKTAARDSEAMARQIAAAGIRAVCIDISRRPREAVTQLAAAMAADYCQLPGASAANMSKLVNTYMESATT